MQIQRSNIIREDWLDQGFYFQSLFQEACNKHLLTDLQIERIQMELVDLMAKEVERFTNDESSSVKIEKAQEILQSITYNIGVYLKSVEVMDEKIKLLINEKISVLFYKGMDTVATIMKDAREMLHALQASNPRLNNISYQDTVPQGISKFFHDYNIEFGAHDAPGDIDYQLFSTITELLGVEYINEYLRRLTLENNLLEHFTDYNINRLLQGYDKDSEHLLINIFELVLANALGCELLGQKITQLNITDKERKLLTKSLEKHSKEQLQNLLTHSLERIGEELKLEAETIVYSKYATIQIADRVYHNLITDTLDKVFLSFTDQTESIDYFEDGKSMEDEKLREIIDKLSECKDSTEKVSMIKETVQSLSDLIEILDVSIYEDEYESAFELLSDNEISHLKKYIQLEAGPEELSDFKPQKEWQKRLLQLYP